MPNYLARVAEAGARMRLPARPPTTAPPVMPSVHLSAAGMAPGLGSDPADLGIVPASGLMEEVASDAMMGDGGTMPSSPSPGAPRSSHVVPEETRPSSPRTYVPDAFPDAVESEPQDVVPVQPAASAIAPSTGVHAPQERRSTESHPEVAPVQQQHEEPEETVAPARNDSAPQEEAVATPTGVLRTHTVPRESGAAIVRVPRALRSMYAPSPNTGPEPEGTTAANVGPAPEPASLAPGNTATPPPLGGKPQGALSENRVQDRMIVAPPAAVAALSPDTGVPDRPSRPSAPQPPATAAPEPGQVAGPPVPRRPESREDEAATADPQPRTHVVAGTNLLGASPAAAVSSPSADLSGITNATVQATSLEKNSDDKKSLRAGPAHGEPPVQPVQLPAPDAPRHRDAAPAEPNDLRAGLAVARPARRRDSDPQPPIDPARIAQRQSRVTIGRVDVQVHHQPPAPVAPVFPPPPKPMAGNVLEYRYLDRFRLRP